MSNRESTDRLSDPWRIDKIDSVMMDVLQRRLAGEQLSDEQVVALHPELMPELAAELRLARELESRGEATADSNCHERASGTVTVRCPNCRDSVRLLPDVPFTEIVCSRCGSRFSLAADADDFENGGAPRKLGHFQLVERLGVGSFGAVWKACDRELDRTVAVKIPHRGHLDADDIERLLREARAAAQLNHKNIVAVHEVGRANGTVFIVNDLVRGQSLSEWSSERTPTFREVAELSVKIADALHHAHVCGVIHRDLKPQNIIMDADDEPHLTDFGLARRDAGETTLTMHGRVIGTPAYMSPEQARGDSHLADCRSDIYSFGVILFELLTGELPFRGNTSMLIHQLMRDDVPSPRKLNRSVPRDLETICLRCLEKQSAKRYGSAREVADEFRRFLAGQPIHARPVSATVRAWRWCGRNPLATTLLVLLLALAVVGPWVAADRTKKATELTTAYRQLKDSSQTMYLDQIQGAVSALNRGDMMSFHERLDSCPDELRRWEWRHLELCRRFADEQGRVLPGITKPVRSLAFSPEGTWFALGAEDGAIRVFGAIDGKEQRKWRGHRAAIDALDFSVDGSQLLAADRDGILKIWDWQTAEEVVALDGGEDAMRFAQFSNDGRHAVFGSGGRISSWDLASHAPSLTSVAQHSGIEPYIISRDLKYGYGRVGVSSFWIFDVVTGNHVTAVHGSFDQLCFTRDATAAIFGGPNGQVCVQQLPKKTGLRALVGRHASSVSSIAVSADSNRVATGDRSGIVKIWDLKTDTELTSIYGHHGAVEDLALSPDGRQGLSRDANATVRLWSTDALQPVVVIMDAGFAEPYAISHDGRWCAARKIGRSHVEDGRQSVIRVWDLATGVPRIDLDLGDLRPTCLDFSQNGSFLAVGCGVDQTIVIWDTADWRQVDRMKVGMDVQALSLSSSGDLLALGGKATSQSTAAVKICRLSTGRSWDISTRQSSIVSLSFSTDERRLAAVSDVGGVLIFDPFKGRQLESLTASAVRHIVFAPDNRWIVGGGDDGLLIWDGQSYEHRQTIRTSGVTSLHMSSDGDRIVAGSTDGMVRVWEPITGKSAIELELSDPNVPAVGNVVFSSDDERLIACGIYASRMCINVWHGTNANGQLPESMADVIRQEMRHLTAADGWQYPVRLACAYVHRMRESEPLRSGFEKACLENLFRQIQESSSARDLPLDRQWNAMKQVVLREQTWLVAGPFPGGPEHEGLSDPMGPELLRPIDPNATFNSIGGPVSWQQVTANAWDVGSETTCSGRHFVDLLRLYPRPYGTVIALAASDVYSPRKQEVDMRIGSDDGVVVWLNDELVHSSLQYREYREGEDRKTVTLQEGHNKLLVKVDQSGGSWGFALEFVDKSSCPAEVRWVTY